MRLEKVVILLLTLGGFALRLYYLTTTHPFFDEYTTVLAARQILQYGWPVLPSGLFYEHGLLSTYLIAPFVALFINTPVAEWQPAHWGHMLARWPSLLVGTATIPLIYTLARRCFSFFFQSPNLPISQSSIPLLAAGLFAVSPEGMVWGGRARMYALATGLVLLTVYWAYRGAVYPAPAKYRWLALGTLLLTLLTQFGTLMLVPPLLAAMLVVGWRSHVEQRSGGAEAQRGRGVEERSQKLRFTFPASRIWFLRPTILLEGFALTVVIAVAIFVKRLGRPLGAAALGSSASNGNLLIDLFNSTVAYQTTFYFTWADTLQFLARQFGVPHHLWLTLLALIGLGANFVIWLISRQPSSISHQWSAVSGQLSASQSPNLQPFDFAQDSSPISNLPISQSPLFPPFLWLTFGLIIIEMVTLLEPFRRNPRYIVMYLPLFYLIAANGIATLWFLLLRITHHASRIRYPAFQTVHTLFTLALLLIFTLIGLPDLRIALLTPEPAYEKAFARVQADWQPGDVLLTMNTPAAGLYLGKADGFTVQNDAGQFLLNLDTEPVDRWLGSPWIGDAAAFNAVLNNSKRAWFVSDTIRQPVYFQGNWLAIVNDQMEPVWAEDNALLYRTRPDRTPLPTHPDTLINATLGDSIELIGYTLREPLSQSLISSLQSPDLHLTLFWQALTPIAADYTVFLHLRDEAGATVAQRDSLPLEGDYPTSRWQPGETVIDPISLPLPDDLPPGSYQLVVGLYQLETLERLPVANDSSGENAIFLGEVVLP